MAVAFHNLELIQYSSQFLNDNVGTVPARYSQFSSNSSSSFEDNPRCFTESPVAIWGPTYAAITSNSPSFFPVGTEETQLEDLLVTDEFLRAIHASNSVGNVDPQPVMINSDSSNIFEHRDQHVTTSHISNDPEHQLHDDHYTSSLEGLLFGQSCADHQVTDQVTASPATSMQAVESEGGGGSPAAPVVVDLPSPPPSSTSQPQPQPLHRQVINLSLLRSWQYLCRCLRMSPVPGLPS